jgi:hypothetical protein
MYPSQKETWVPFKSYEIHACLTSVVSCFEKVLVSLSIKNSVSSYRQQISQGLAIRKNMNNKIWETE